MDIAASLIKLIFGSKADKDRKQIEPYLEKIKAVYPAIEALSNDELRARSEALKKHAIIATGVASPRAHGQLITSTLIALASAKDIPLPKSNHTINVTAAMPITVGTNMPETLSAIFAIGAFDAAAFSTISMI